MMYQTDLFADWTNVATAIVLLQSRDSFGNISNETGSNPSLGERLMIIKTSKPQALL